MDLNQKVVVLSGAGISAESGIPTFRGIDGLWEGHRVEDVASPQGWSANREMVLEFYNMRRKAVLEAEPNEGHKVLARMEDQFDVQIITQNIDDLHERGGSSKILHLHGEIRKARSTANPSLIYNIQGPHLNVGDTCELGSQLRPHIVWFGEDVPLIRPAAQMVSEADVLIVVGTSLNVYPAAGLLHYAKDSSRKFLVDPNVPNLDGFPTVEVVAEGGGTGLQKVYASLLN